MQWLRRLAPLGAFFFALVSIAQAQNIKYMNQLPPAGAASDTDTFQVCQVASGCGSTNPLNVQTLANLTPWIRGKFSATAPLSYNPSTGVFSSSAGGGTPGGSSGQLQWNNAGAFAGATIGAGLSFTGGTLSATGGGGGGNIPVNDQTGHATYTVLSSDQGKLVTFCVTSGNVAVTLPQAGSAGFAANWGTTLHNVDKNASGVTCTGNVVVTPTTSKLNGQTSVTLTPGSAVSTIVDAGAVNYYGPQTIDTATSAGGIVIGTTTVTGGTCPSGQNIYNNAGVAGCQANGTGGGGITCDTGFTASFGECVWTKTPAADATNCKSNSNAVNCMAWTGLVENRYRLKCSNLFGANGTAILDIQIFNGTSWQEGATAYTFTQLGNTVTGTFQTNQGITLPGIQAVYNHKTTAPFGATIMSEFNDLASTTVKKVIDFRAAYEDSTASAQLTYVGFGYYSGDNNAITGIRVIDVQGTPGSIAAGGTCTLTQMGS